MATPSNTSSKESNDGDFTDRPGLYDSGTVQWPHLPCLETPQRYGPQGPNLRRGSRSNYGREGRGVNDVHWKERRDSPLGYSHEVTVSTSVGQGIPTQHRGICNQDSHNKYHSANTMGDPSCNFIDGRDADPAHRAIRGVQDTPQNPEADSNMPITASNLPKRFEAMATIASNCRLEESPHLSSFSNQNEVIAKQVPTQQSHDRPTKATGPFPIQKCAPTASAESRLGVDYSTRRPGSMQCSDSFTGEKSASGQDIVTASGVHRNFSQADTPSGATTTRTHFKSMAATTQRNTPDHSYGDTMTSMRQNEVNLFASNDWHLFDEGIEVGFPNRKNRSNLSSKISHRHESKLSDSDHKLEPYYDGAFMSVQNNVCQSTKQPFDGTQSDASGALNNSASITHNSPRQLKRFGGPQSDELGDSNNSTTTTCDIPWQLRFDKHVSSVPPVQQYHREGDRKGHMVDSIEPAPSIVTPKRWPSCSVLHQTYRETNHYAGKSRIDHALHSQSPDKAVKGRNSQPSLEGTGSQEFPVFGSKSRSSSLGTPHTPIVSKNQIMAPTQLMGESSDSLMATDGGSKIRSIALIGKIGHGKTRLLNSICATSFVSNMGNSSCTRTIQVGTTCHHGIQVKDTPGLYAADDLTSHCEWQKKALEEDLLSGVYAVVKCGRVADMEGLINPIMDFVGNDDIRIIGTHLDEMMKKSGFDPMETKQYLSSSLEIPLEHIALFGKETPSEDIEYFIYSTLHPPREFKVEEEQVAMSTSVSAGAAEKKVLKPLEEALAKIQAALVASLSLATDEQRTQLRNKEMDIAIMTIRFETVTMTHNARDGILRMAKNLPPEQAYKVRQRIEGELVTKLEHFVKETNRCLSFDTGVPRNDRRMCHHCGAVSSKPSSNVERDDFRCGNSSHRVIGPVRKHSSRLRVEFEHDDSTSGWKVLYFINGTSIPPWNLRHEIQSKSMFNSRLKSVCNSVVEASIWEMKDRVAEIGQFLSSSEYRQHTYFREVLTLEIGDLPQEGCGNMLLWSTMKPVHPDLTRTAQVQFPSKKRQNKFWY